MNSLIEIIFFSEKRKAVLILLFEKGPLPIETIKSELNETSVSILPQIKVLIDSNLVIQNDGIYQLTHLGETVTEKVSPFVKNLQVLSVDPKFWSEHDTGEIPEKLFNRIQEIGDFKIIEIDLRTIYYEPNPIILEHLNNANSIKTFITYYAPEYVTIYYERLLSGAPVSITTSDYIVNMAKDYKNEINNLLQLDRAELNICSADIKIAEVTVTDKILLMVLYSTSGNLDYDFLAAESPSAVQWGNELYEYLKSRSVNKKEI
ncbi:MAG: winged helix-turn-helix domain-containing protein [Methanosarcinales archaeon]|jgi:predicted transcriptional regulator|nr:winged helix-turn-helix domain-containing protein [Methanosarcinales archaeon]